MDFGKKPWIRKRSDIVTKDEESRVYLDDEIKLSDETIVVNSQITAADMPKILKIAGDLGYNIMQE